MSKMRILASAVALGAVLTVAGVVGAVAFASVSGIQTDSPNLARSFSTEDEKPASEEEKAKGSEEKLKTTDADELCNTITHPVVIEKVNPKYPDEAKKEKIMGSVTVEAVITEDGIVEDLTVVKSAHESLSVAAMDAIAQWKFEPALCDGKPVGVYYNLTVKFSLR